MATDVKLRLLIETVDRAGKSLQQAKDDLNKIKSAASDANASSKKMGVEGAKSVDKFSASLTQLNEKFKQSSKLADQMASIGAKLAATGAVLGGISFFPVKAAANFEQALARVRAVTLEVGVSYEDLKKKAADLGRTTQFTAVQAADGMRYLGMAGLNTKQVFDAIAPTLDLAAAGELELARAADIATNIMSAFQMQVEDLPHVMDVLAFTAASSNTNVEQLAEAMKYAGPIASAAGVSLEECAATMAALANSGIQASMAGTNVRGVLASLIKPTTESEAVLDKLAVTIEKNEKGEINLIAAMGELAKAGLLADDAFTLFRRTSASGGIVIARNVEWIEKFKKSLNGTTTELGNAEGAAKKMRETMTNTLLGKWELFTSAVTGLMIVLGDKLIPVLTTVTQKISEWTGAIGDFLARHSTLATAIVTLTAGFGALIFSLGAVLVPLALLVKSISILGIKMTAIPGLGHTIAVALTGMGTAFKAASVSAYALLTAMNALQAIGLVALFAAVATVVYKAVAAFNEAKEASDRLAVSQEKLDKTAKSLVDKYKEFANLKIPSSSEIIGRDREHLEKMNAELRKSQAYWMGVITQLQKAADETDSMGLSTDEAIEAQKKLITAREQWNGLTKSIGEVKVALRSAAGEYKDFWQVAKPPKASAKVDDDILKFDRATQEMRIAIMKDGLAKIEAQRVLELEKFKASEEAKKALPEQTQERINIINEKYGKERLDFLEKQRQKEAKSLTDLSKIELDAQKDANARYLELLELQKEDGLVTTSEYYSERARLLKEETEKEIEILKQQLQALSKDSTEIPAIELEIKLKSAGLADQLKVLDAQQRQAQQDQLNREKELQLQLADISAGAHESRWAREDAYLEVDRQRADQQMQLTLQDMQKRGATETELERAKEEMKYAINQEYADKTKALWDSRIAEAASGFSDMAENLGTLYDAGGKKIKAFFYLQKAAAIASAIADTYLGATKAFNSMAALGPAGPAMGYAAAAAAIAAGMSRVAAIRAQTLASGGEVQGYSPHKRADNIPIMATAKEYVQPVDTVQYYGKGVMEALRKKLIPKELLTGYRNVPVFVRPTRRFAEGGQVPSTPRQSTSMTSQKAQPPQPIKIINFTDRSEMLAALNSGEGEQAIINVISRNNDKVKRMLR